MWVTHAFLSFPSLFVHNLCTRTSAIVVGKGMLNVRYKQLCCLVESWCWTRDASSSLTNHQNCSQIRTVYSMDLLRSMDSSQSNGHSFCCHFSSIMCLCASRLLVCYCLRSVCKAAFLHHDAEATDRPNAHPWCVYMLSLIHI